MTTPRRILKVSPTGKVVLRDSGGSGRTVTWTVRRGSEKRSDYMPSQVTSAGPTKKK
jgi:hypothetical protein